MSGLLVYIIYFYQKTKIKAIEGKKQEFWKTSTVYLPLAGTVIFFLGSSKYKPSNQGISKWTEEM